VGVGVGTGVFVGANVISTTGLMRIVLFSTFLIFTPKTLPIFLSLANKNEPIPNEIIEHEKTILAMRKTGKRFVRSLLARSL
jgi:hypothetical protein